MAVLYRSFSYKWPFILDLTCFGEHTFFILFINDHFIPFFVKWDQLYLLWLSLHCSNTSIIIHQIWLANFFALRYQICSIRSAIEYWIYLSTKVKITGWCQYRFSKKMKIMRILEINFVSSQKSSTPISLVPRCYFWHWTIFSNSTFFMFFWNQFWNQPMRTYMHPWLQNTWNQPNFLPWI